ncbi:MULTISPECIES: hypothetical protein [Methylocystis]|uniref:Uncharacterized protein n=1 Tax=Methylocystis rosea TaxID=173366 RepID=A0A3G8M8U9_9HYPH|nr:MULTISPECIES: hypothetical protein [Methylocystis]AZG78423.1 hypothetical protein EHO51_17780 [Methylocystis rosea]CCJ07325.1 Uncharacterized protein BN69_1874 [Methylocystis sp. SC2]
MTKQHLAHEYLTWAKQKLDEIDATLAAVDGSIEAWKSDARTDAIARIRTARDAFKAKVDAVQSEVAAAKAIADDAYVAIEADLTEFELAFRDFLTAAEGQANVVKKALAARAEAQRRSWQSSLQSIRDAASASIDHALGEADAAFRHVAAETEKVEAKIGKVSTAGDESWKAIKGGLDEAISVYERAWKKISEAVAKIG